MSNFDDLLNSLREDLRHEAESSFAEFKDDFVADGLEFTNSIRDDLERWSSLLIEGKLSKDDFESLVKGKAALLKMKAIRHRAEAVIKADELKNRILLLVVKAALRVLLP